MLHALAPVQEATQGAGALSAQKLQPSLVALTALLACADRNSRAQALAGETPHAAAIHANMCVPRKHCTFLRRRACTSYRHTARGLQRCTSAHPD